MIGVSRTWMRLAFAAVALAWALEVRAQPSCPPVAQAPTPDQILAAQRQARDRGLLWRISKGGRDSYLFGTLHVGKLAWAVPGPKLRAAIAATDTLAVEIDLTDPEVQKTLTTRVSGARDTAMELPQAVAKRLARQREAACVPEFALAPLHPVMQAVTLSVLAARWEGLDPAFAQEATLGGAARAMQRTIVALESVGLQLSVIVPDDSVAALKAIERMLDELEQDRVRPVIRRLADAWEQGRLADLEDYGSWCDCMNDDDDRAFFRRLNDDRNPGLADRIDALHMQGKHVLAAVGALHMTGAKGLPKLMAERGYLVERIGFAPI